MTEEERKRDHDLARKPVNAIRVKAFVTRSPIHHGEIVTKFPYFLHRLDRKERRGGGVCRLVRVNLHVHSVDRASPNKADVLRVDLLCPHNASRIRFILVYRPPNVSKNVDEELIDVLRDTVATHTNTIMLESSLFLKFFRGSGLKQHVSLPTHGRNILDLVLSTFNNIREVTISSPLANSDHSIVRFKVLGDLDSYSTVPLPDFLNVDYRGLDG
ncbi:hypothetical protein COOONC_00308 [Cooperia oncophora]